MKVSLLFCLVTLASCSDPRQYWKEHWFEHKQILNRVYFESDVAVYFDNDVDKSIQWMNQYLHNVWVYVKKTYGQFGSDPRLFAIFHTGKYGGGHPTTYFDDSHDYRNVIDCGSPSKFAWHSGAGNDLDLPTHEIAHIVEVASRGVHGSPAFSIWRNSKWAEIFIYDVFKGLGRRADVRRWHDMQVRNSDNFPRANTYWFRDWFLPIYKQYGGSQVLKRFFKLLARHFPKSNLASNNRPQYTRDMNHGEFFHFWSGAAKTNLKDLATNAFGWSDHYQREFDQAQKDFPNIKYKV